MYKLHSVVFKEEKTGKEIEIFNKSDGNVNVSEGVTYDEIFACKHYLELLLEKGKEAISIMK